MRVSVVVPVYNRAGMIVSCLDSVAQQSLTPDRLVVVDDGSTDDTALTVQAWASAHPNLDVRLIRSPNNGAAAARNLGLRGLDSNSDFVAFLDSDDIWPNDFLRRATHALMNDEHAVAATADREFWYPENGSRRTKNSATLTANPWLWFIKHGAGIGSATLFRTSIIKTVGGYPEEVPTGHDSVLFGRIAKQGRWLHLPGVPVTFRRSLTAKTNGADDHLYRKYPDYLTWWAIAADTVWREAPRWIRYRPDGRRSIADRWSRAAQASLRRGDGEHAKEFLRQACTICPWGVKYWWYWLTRK